MNSQTIQFSFPKTQRFSKQSSINQPILYLPGSKNNRYSSIGKGKKYMYHQFHFPRAVLNPSPDQYFINIDKKTHFGVDYSRSGGSFNKINFQKQLIEKPLKRYASQVEFQKYNEFFTAKKYLKDIQRSKIKIEHQLCFQQAEETPGPGQYHLERTIGDNRNKITMSKKTQLNSEFYLNPAPNTYSPNFQFIQKNGPLNTFGFGRKLKIQEITQSMKEQNNPGPGMYDYQNGFKVKSKNVKLNPPQFVQKT